MKVFLFAFAVLAGVSAVPQTRNQGRLLVEPAIRDAIAGLKESIREAGLDPLEIEEERYSFELPVTDLLSAQAAVEDILVEGLSNIAIHEMDFNLIFARLRFDISLPLISANIGAVGGRVDFANRRVTAGVSGSLKVVSPRVSGEVRFNRVLILIGQIQVTSLAVNFRIADIQSDLSVAFQDNDYSDFVNNVFGVVIPAFFTNFRTDINRLLVHYLTDIINNIEL